MTEIGMGLLVGLAFGTGVLLPPGAVIGIVWLLVKGFGR